MNHHLQAMILHYISNGVINPFGVHMFGYHNQLCTYDIIESVLLHTNDH